MKKLKNKVSLYTITSEREYKKMIENNPDDYIKFKDMDEFMNEVKKDSVLNELVENEDIIFIYEYKDDIYYSLYC